MKVTAAPSGGNDPNARRYPEFGYCPPSRPLGRTRLNYLRLHGSKAVGLVTASLGHKVPS